MAGAKTEKLKKALDADAKVKAKAEKLLEQIKAEKAAAVPQSEEDLEAALAEHVASFVDDPLGFVYFAFAWGEGELKGETGPDDWQVEVLQYVGDNCLTIEAALRVAISAGNGAGKSALAAWLMLWVMSTRPNLAGVVTANTRSQLSSKTWRELSIWHKRAINAHWFEWSATKFAHVASPETWFLSAITWSKDNPEAFAGLHAEHVFVLFDESSSIPDIIWETIEGAMTTKGAMWVVLGNATRNTGRFRECWGRFRNRWYGKKVDTRTCKKVNREQIAQWLADYGEDSDFFRVRVRGEFPQSSSTQFIGLDIVEAAQKRELSNLFTTPKILGVDVARFGDDSSVILLRSGDNVHDQHIWQFRGLDTVQLAHRVAEIINMVQPDGVVVDGTGLGAGVVDILKGLNHKVFEYHGSAEPRDKKMYLNLRAEAWGRMKTWLGNGRSRIPPNNEQLRDDLIGLEYGFNIDGQIKLESKDDLKKRGLASPDLADALSMTFAKDFASEEVRKLMGTSKRMPSSYASGPGSSSAKDFASRYRRTPKGKLEWVSSSRRCLRPSSRRPSQSCRCPSRTTRPHRLLPARKALAWPRSLAVRARS